MLGEHFENFCREILIDNLDEIQTSVGEIAKKLNLEYYETQGDKESNIYIVGSIGRGTAIKNCSDVDLIFDLPQSVYDRFDAYENNGQSALLQEIKSVLKERYPRTDMRGDGQVVVIEFDKYTIELVPGFKQSDDSFTYPDTHDGGSWKRTDPLSEQAECKNADADSNGIYSDFCHLIRAWKNECGFKFGGLLIDTLVYNHFKEKDYYKDSTADDYFDILINLLEYLKSQDKNQSYWLAVGSNQYVYNSDNGKFVNKAKKAHKKLTEAKDDEILDALAELFGKDFKPKEETKNLYESCNYRHTEEFIENIFYVDIKYNLSIDCEVSQSGFRNFFLRRALSENHILRHNKSLRFFIDNIDVPKPYDIYWKVRNVGAVAEEKDQIRGQINKTNLDYQREKTSFRGSHFVECYIIKNQVCVARARIDVPIGNF